MAASRAILGISPGTRTMGLSVIHNGELIEWRVKTFKGPWSKEKLAHIFRVIENMRAYFGISVVAIKKVDPLKCSPQLLRLTDHIMVKAKKKGVRTAMYSIHDLYVITGKKERHLHNAIAEYVLGIYPGVRGEYMKERNNRREYYAKMFEAVLCAHMQYEKDNKV